MKTITPPILEALKMAVTVAGNPSQFANKIPGIKQTTIRNWLLGITKTISDENWQKVEPFINQWLKASPDAINECLRILQELKRKEQIIFDYALEYEKSHKSKYGALEDPQYIKLLDDFSEQKNLVVRHLEFYCDQFSIDLLEKIFLLIKDTPKDQTGIFLDPSVNDVAEWEKM